MRKFHSAGGCRSGALAGLQRDRLSQSAGICQRPLLGEGHRTENVRALLIPAATICQTAFSYFLKSAELNLAPGIGKKLWILLALAGVLACLIARFVRKSNSLVSQRADRPQWWPLLLLWIPLPFYALSVAYGGVPIFMPVWWPFSYYNVRYGLELLPAFAVFAALAVYFVREAGAESRHQACASRRRALIFVDRKLRFDLAGSGLLSRSLDQFPHSHRPGARTRRFREELSRLIPPCSCIWATTWARCSRPAIPLRRVINEGNHRTWKQPVDPEGLWERALANPAQYADFVIAFDGDAVSTGVQKQDLIPLAVIHVSGQPKATIYQTHAPCPVIICVNLPTPEAVRDRSFPVIKSSHSASHADRCNTSTMSCRVEMSSAGISLLRLMLAARPGRPHRTGAGNQASPRRAAHQSFYLSRRGHVYLALGRAGGRASSETTPASRRRSFPASVSSAPARSCTIAAT